MAKDTEKKQRYAKVMKMHEHLSKVIVPALKNLATSIQTGGQKATVVETEPLGSPETSTAHVKLTIVPRGHETVDPNELPRLLFRSGPGGIVVTEYAFFPGRGGDTTSSQPYLPGDLDAEKVEILVLQLVERSFSR